ncbi:hypothetical protein B4U79_12648, partial [Dinothrombium tinctorium]
MFLAKLITFYGLILLFHAVDAEDDNNNQHRNSRRRVSLYDARNLLKQLFISQNAKTRSGDGPRARPMVVAKASHMKKKKAFCRISPLKQRIFDIGCRPKMILNNYCYGQCQSFYIPSYTDDFGNSSSSGDSSTKKANIEEAAFKSCAFCKPHQS